MTIPTHLIMHLQWEGETHTSDKDITADVHTANSVKWNRFQKIIAVAVKSAVLRIGTLETNNAQLMLNYFEIRCLLPPTTYNFILMYNSQTLTRSLGMEKKPKPTGLIKI